MWKQNGPSGYTGVIGSRLVRVEVSYACLSPTLSASVNLASSFVAFRLALTLPHLLCCLCLQFCFSYPHMNFVRTVDHLLGLALSVTDADCVGLQAVKSVNKPSECCGR